VNIVDVRSQSNFELSMRIQSNDFKSEDEQFYTDLNGFQMIRRKRFEKLPIQAHFYPMTTAAFIDSGNKRLTLLGRQSLGVASLYPGTVETILDRRLGQDDDRGVAQGVLDNKRTESHFRLHIESISQQPNREENRAGFLSTSAIHSSHSLNYPIMTLYGQFDSSKLPQSWSPLKKSLSCDTHLFAFRALSQPTSYTTQGGRQTKPMREASLILERHGVECLVNGTVGGCSGLVGQFQPQAYFDLKANSFKSTSLTGMYEDTQSINQLKIDPMDLKAIKVEF